MTHQVAEIYTSGEHIKKTFAYTEQPEYLYDQLREVFPWINRENYISISTPTYHEILEEQVMTCCLPRGYSVAMFGENTMLTARKFCMESATSYIRAYYPYTGDTPDWLPEGCILMFYTENVAEYGRPFTEQSATFGDYYFKGDPGVVEAAFDLPEKRGGESTYYGVTMVNDNVTRVKQYCYDSQSTFFNWIALYNLVTGADGSTGCRL